MMQILTLKGIALKKKYAVRYDVGRHFCFKQHKTAKVKNNNH